MALYRRRRVGKGIWRGRRNPGRRWRRMARMRYASRISTPTFTETFNLTSLSGNLTAAGLTCGIWTVAANQIPEFAQYAALYNQYCIRKVQLMVLPEYTTYQSAVTTSLPYGITVPRLAYAVQDSAQQVAPTTEIQVLEDNGVKIKRLDNTIRINFRPVAQVGVAASSGGFVSETKKNRWISTASPEVPHAGVAFALTQTFPSTYGSPSQPPVAMVYAKITFSLRDPK